MADCYYVVQFQAEEHENCKCFSEKYLPPIRVPAELATGYDLGTKYAYYPCPICTELNMWKRSWWAVRTANEKVTRYDPQTVVFVKNVMDGTRGLLLGQLKSLRSELDIAQRRTIHLTNLTSEIIQLMEEN